MSGEPEETLEQITIPDVMMWDQVDPEHPGDTVKGALEKINANFTKVSTGTGVGNGGNGSGSDPTDGGYIDTNPDYTQYFAGDSLHGWTVENGTGVVDTEQPRMIWTAGPNSAVFKEDSAIEGRRYTHFVVEIERTSGGVSDAQRVTTKSPGHGYDFNTHFATPVGGQVNLVLNQVRFLVFEMGGIANWNDGTTTGIKFKCGPDAGSYIIHSIRLAGPDSSFVQTALTQAVIAQEMAELAAERAEAEKVLAEVRATEASDAAAAALISETNSGEHANAAQNSRNEALDYANASGDYASDAGENAAKAEVAGRFALYHQVHPTISTDFADDIAGWSGVDATLSHVGGNLRVTHSGLDGHILSADSLNFAGSLYNKVVIRARVITGSIADFDQARLFYSTTTRVNMDGSHFIRPMNWDKLKLDADNTIYLMFDVTQPNNPDPQDWLADTVRRLRFDLANVDPLVYDIDYIYLLGTEAAFPYKQAQAAATSAANALAAESQAGQYAEAALQHATDAETAKSDASTFASQASTAVTDAQGAASTATNAAGAAASSRDEASGYASDAEAYRTQAATSASNAAGSAAEASESAVIAARVSPGIPITLNSSFGKWTGDFPDGFENWTGATTTNIIKNTANAIYSANSLQMVASSTSDLGLVATTQSSMMQLIDAAYYVLDVDVTLVSGVATGAGLLIRKTYSDTSVDDVQIPLTDFDITGDRYVYSKMVPHPSDSGKTMSQIDIRLIANWGANFGGSAIKTLRWNKVTFRTATSAEIASGQIGPEIVAAIEQEAQARANADGEIEAKYSVKVDANGYVSGYGLIATANNGVPTSEMVFLVDKFKIVAPAGGGNAATPKQMFAVGNVNGTPTLVMNGNMIADGSIMARSLLIGVGGNQIDNADLSAGMTNYIPGTTNAEFTTGIRKDTYTPPSGAIEIFQTGTSATNFDVYCATPEGDIRYFDVAAGKKYEFSFYSYSHRCQRTGYITWYNSSTQAISSATVTTLDGENGDPQYSLAAYTRHGVIAVAPEGAVKARLRFRKLPTNLSTNSAAWFCRPFFAEASDNQTEFSPWSVGGATKIGGGHIATNSITTDHLNVTNLAAINANLGAVTAGSINIANKFVLATDGTVTIRNATTGARLEITSTRISVYDASNVLRVRMGQL